MKEKIADIISSRRIWVLSGLLMVPPFLYYLVHFLNILKPDTIPTGYIQYDMPYYMANALEYKESKDLHLLFRLPFSSNYDNQPIYFYPLIFLMGLIVRYTAIQPYILFIFVGFVFSLLTIRVCLLILTKYCKVPSKLFPVISAFFMYGGGVLFIAGFIKSLRRSKDFFLAVSKGFHFDPSDGWWFLNLGRNFLFPMEAYYHFLFLGIVYLILQKKILTASFAALLLALSHPFTGIAMLLIFISWAMFERIIKKSNAVSWAPIGVLFISLCWFLYYNFIFLPSDVEHSILVKQWTLDWSTGVKNYFYGYILVLIPAIIRLASVSKLKLFFSEPFNRFLAVWLFINIGLENHQLLIKPHQPLHFTRGYVWICLFLIGAPVLISMLQRIMQIKKLSPKAVLLTIVFLLFFSDNISWFSVQAQKMGGYISISNDQKSVLDFLNENYNQKELLISQDEFIGYLSSVYTPYRALYSHMHNTPNNVAVLQKQNNFIDNGIQDSMLTSVAKVVVVRKGKGSNTWKSKSQLLFQNSSFEVWRQLPGRSQ